MYLLAQLLNLYSLGLLVYVILSWVQSPGVYKIRDWLGMLYEPLLSPLRGMLRSMNLGGMGFDFSPILLFFIIALVRRLLFSF